MSFDLRPWEFSASGTLRSGPSAGEGGLSPANHLPLLSAGARATTAFSVADGRTTTAGSPGPRVTSPTTSPRGLMTGAPNPSVATEVGRLALFLTTAAARHITGQTLHVSHGALASFA